MRVDLLAIQDMEDQIRALYRLAQSRGASFADLTACVQNPVQWIKSHPNECYPEQDAYQRR